MSIGKEYLKVILERFISLKDLGDKTIQQLSDQEIHWTYNEEANSVAIIVKHMSGNMLSRWTDFLTQDGEKEYRNRDNEFVDDISSKYDLIIVWEKGWKALFDALTSLREEDLLKEITIRGEKHTVIEAVERQVAHYGYHVGQIVFIGKQMKNDLWQNLSIPKGRSEVYLKKMLKKHRGQ